MKILHCDVCHAEVNDYSHWYNDEKPRNMYELKCVHESNSDTYNGMIICHKCIGKLIYKAEKEGMETDDKYGHWIVHNNKGIIHLECSKCKTWFLREHLARNSFCPNCGCNNYTMIGDKE